MMPLTIMFMPESAFGPTNNCIGLGDVLRRRGHRVVFAAEASWKGKLQDLGFEEDLVHLAPPEDLVDDQTVTPDLIAEDDEAPLLSTVAGLPRRAFRQVQHRDLLVLEPAPALRTRRPYVLAPDGRRGDHPVSGHPDMALPRPQKADFDRVEVFRKNHHELLIERPGEEVTADLLETPLDGVHPEPGGESGRRPGAGDPDLQPP